MRNLLKRSFFLITTIYLASCSGIERDKLIGLWAGEVEDNGKKATLVMRVTNEHVSVVAIEQGGNVDKAQDNAEWELDGDIFRIKGANKSDTKIVSVDDSKMVIEHSENGKQAELKKINENDLQQLERNHGFTL